MMDAAGVGVNQEATSGTQSSTAEVSSLAEIGVGAIWKGSLGEQSSWSTSRASRKIWR